jgi:hypothetical protein
MVIPFASGPVTLDGIASEEFYSEAQSTIIFDPISDTGSLGDEDLAATFKVCYDNEFLYVQANIIDNVETGPDNDANDPWTNMNPNDSWQYDNSEIFFDLDTNGAAYSPSSTAYDSTCVQFRINRGRDSLMTASANTHELPLADPLRFLYQANDGNGAWLYEVAIPWTAIAPKGSDASTIASYLAEGKVHGFDVSFGDADKIAGAHINRDRQAAWDVEPGYSETTYNNRKQFGVVTLSNSPPPPPPESSWLAPIRNMAIPFASGPVTLDGIAEEFYSDEQTTTIYHPLIDAGLLGDADLSAAFKVCFDSEFLYVLANITDGVEDGPGNDANDSWPGTDPNFSWAYDNSEIFFDLDTNGAAYSPSPTAYDSTCVQFRVIRGRDSLFTASANTHDLPKIDPSTLIYQANIGNNAWLYEVAIPWNTIAPKGSDADRIQDFLAEGMVHGFDVSFGDADKIAGVHTSRDRQAAWDVEPGYIETTYNNRTQFGLVSLCYDCIVVKMDETGYRNSGNLIVYPNPSSGLVTFENPESETTVKVMNITGQVLLLDKLKNNTLDMSQFENGIYFISIDNHVLKLIKQ